jgi:hypothetical protein
VVQGDQQAHQVYQDPEEVQDVVPGPRVYIREYVVADPI